MPYVIRKPGAEEKFYHDWYEKNKSGLTYIERPRKKPELHWHPGK